MSLTFFCSLSVYSSTYLLCLDVYFFSKFWKFFTTFTFFGDFLLRSLFEVSWINFLNSCICSMKWPISVDLNLWVLAQKEHRINTDIYIAIHNSSKITKFVVVLMNILTEVRWNFTVVLSSIFLIAKDVKHLGRFLLAIK